MKKRGSFSIFGEIRPQMQVTFFSVLIIGFVAHGMGLLNKYSTHDDIIGLFWTGTTIASGRWMLHVVGWLETLLFGDGHFSLPIMNGLFSLCCIGLAACLMVDLLQIRKKSYCITLGGIMAAFPTVAGLFGYMFTIPYYMMAMMMMVFSAWLICKTATWWGKIVAIVVGGCSIGIYQAFLPMLLSITLLYDLLLFSEAEEKNGQFLKRVLIQILCILAVMAFYFAANRFFVVKYDVVLNSYMGINQVGTTSIETYLERAGKAYQEFFLPERNVSSDMYPMHVYYMHFGMVIMDVLLGLRLIIREGKKNVGRAVLLTVLIGFVPLGCNFIYVMSEKVHGLMTYSVVVQVAFCLWLLDRLEIQQPKLRRVVSGLAAAAMALTCIMYARFDNQCYLKTAFQQQQAISWMTTLVSRIKAMPGYRDETPVAFLNAEAKNDEALYNIDELDFIHQPPYGDNIIKYLNSYAWSAFMGRWCGFSPVYADPANWAEREDCQTMPHYPDDGSIREIEGTILVNF